ncbi:MAG: universal stress protein, partial [Candidatus Rokuibacteriota bacterium]
TLMRRWPDVQTAVVDGPPADAIIGQTRRSRARAIVLGWRGHGALRRLVMGSVSRAVVRRAPCPVLVVRRAPRAVRRLVLGLDGSPHAQRAVVFIAHLVPPKDGRATLVRVVESMRAPSTRVMPRSVGAMLRGELAAINAVRVDRARRNVRRAASRLRAARWPEKLLVRPGLPVRELLAVVKAERADLLVVGARGVRGVERLLLGSVAEGALGRSPVPVLVVR